LEEAVAVVHVGVVAILGASRAVTFLDAGSGLHIDRDWSRPALLISRPIALIFHHAPDESVRARFAVGRCIVAVEVLVAGALVGEVALVPPRRASASLRRSGASFAGLEVDGDWSGAAHHGSRPVAEVLHRRPSQTVRTLFVVKRAI